MDAATAIGMSGTMWADCQPSRGSRFTKASRTIHGTSRDQSFAKAWKIKQSFDSSLSAWFTLVEQVFAPHLPAPLAPKLFDALYQRFTQTTAWHVYDDVKPTLAALRQRGYRLGVVSNWDERLKKLLTDLQLSHYFEAIVLSVDVGAGKPSPKIFAHTLNLLKLPASAVLHIGDSMDEDVIGPQQRGIPALLLNRRRKTSHSVPVLTDILPVLPGVPHFES